MLRRLIAIVCTLCMVWALLAQTPTPVVAQSDDPCAKLPASKLKDGDKARVAKLNDSRVPGGYLKGDASTLGPVLRYLPIGTVVTVSDKPTCTTDGNRWWKASLGDLKGWMIESAFTDFLLEPFTTGDVPKPLDTTTLPLLFCIRPVLGTQAANSTPGTPGPTLFRAVFASPDGSLSYSDNGGATRVIANFNPPPTNVDLAPDGSAVLVVNYNGVYWVDVITGKTVLIADATTFQLSENAWPRRATWLPDGSGAAIEIENTNESIVSYVVWNLPVNGIGQPFQATTGIVPKDSVRRAPARDKVILSSVNDFSPYPNSPIDDTPALLEFVPRYDESDARFLLTPAIAWAPDGLGFYTYIPNSSMAPEGDPIKEHLWYVPLTGKPEDKGKPRNVKADEYVIPSPDGKHLLLGSGRNWRIQDIEGKVLQQANGLRFLFNWTPDSKGIVYSVQNGGTAAYLGIDGTKTSDFLPKADNLFDINWLSDGTILYTVQGKDGKLSFSVKRQGSDAVFLGLINTVSAYSAATFKNPPPAGVVPQACGK